MNGRLRRFEISFLRVTTLPFAVLAFGFLAVGWLELSLYDFTIPEYPLWRLRPLGGNVLLMSGYAALCFLLLPRTSAAITLAGFPVALIGMINARKIAEIGDPIQAFDVFQLRNAPVLIGYLSNRQLLFLIVAGSIVLLTIRRRGRPRFAVSAVAFLLTTVGGAGAVAVSLSSPSISWANRALDTYDYYWDPLENHRSNGFAVAALLYLSQMAVTVPNR